MTYICRNRGVPVLGNVSFGSKDTFALLVQAIEEVRYRGIDIVGIEFWGRFVVCVLEEDPTPIQLRLPREIAGIWTQYEQKDHIYESANHRSLLRGIAPDAMIGSLVTRNSPDSGCVEEGITMALIATRLAVDDPESCEQDQYVYDRLIYWEGLWN